MDRTQTTPSHRPYIATLLMMLVTALLLRAQGRIWIAASGKVLLWVSDTFSSENSQHISDPYTFSHMQHGLVFYFFLLWMVPKIMKRQITFGWRFFWSATLEAGWELLENSKMVIDRYRNETAAFGYTGDSILNSMADIVFCSMGFVIAHMLGWKKTLALFLMVELSMILLLKDSLMINVIMLLYPLKAIKEWQLSG